VPFGTGAGPGTTAARHLLSVAAGHYRQISLA